ncbi:MAG: serine hydrolase family protein [Hyphomicrobiales bacterium]|nr:serine hydrolase family protein [Hyphomicrobiales bacterium]
MTLELSSFDFLILPGRGNANAGHWQSHWLAAFPNSSRILQASWDQPDPVDWIARIDSAVALAPRKVVFVAHSLATAAVVKWAAEATAERHAKIAGAFLVATTDVSNPDPAFDLVRPFAPVPLQPLPFPALVVASRNDPRVTPERSREFAAAWRADFADVGELGHMGADAGLGIWPTGLLLLGRLLAKAR